MNFPNCNYISSLFNFPTQMQPGCGTNVTCHHARSQEYFTISTDPQFIFEGEKCDSFIKFYYHQFRGHKCSDIKDRMGVYSDKKAGRFFVSTNAKPPFAKLIVKRSDKKN